MQRTERVVFLKECQRECVIGCKRISFTGKGSASGSRSGESRKTGRQTRRRALNALREGLEPLNRVEPRNISSLWRNIPRFFVSEEGNQATAKPAFGFTRAYTKQMQKSRSDDSAKQKAFVSDLCQGNQATAKPAFGFTRAYTKQMQKSRSDDSAKQKASKKECYHGLR